MRHRAAALAAALLAGVLLYFFAVPAGVDRAPQPIAAVAPVAPTQVPETPAAEPAGSQRRVTAFVGGDGLMIDLTFDGDEVVTLPRLVGIAEMPLVARGWRAITTVELREVDGVAVSAATPQLAVSASVGDPKSPRRVLGGGLSSTTFDIQNCSGEPLRLGLEIAPAKGRWSAGPHRLLLRYDPSLILTGCVSANPAETPAPRGPM